MPHTNVKTIPKRFGVGFGVGATGNIQRQDGRSIEVIAN